jgi:hypothetical protein
VITGSGGVFLGMGVPASFVQLWIKPMEKLMKHIAKTNEKFFIINELKSL